MSDLLDLTIVRLSPQAAVVVATGEIDLSNRDELANLLEQLGWARWIAVDLRQCSFFDCSALRVLNRSARTMRREGRTLTVTAGGNGRRLIELAGLPHLLGPAIAAAQPIGFAA